MIRKLTTLQREKGSDYATLRFYVEKTRFVEDTETLVSLTQVGWVRTAVRDIGHAMIERDITEFWTEEDIRLHQSMAEEQ